jgi:hypothetical protein
MKFPMGRWFESNHCVVKLLAVRAQDGLDNHMPSAIRPARHAGTITAFGTFEEIRATHKPLAELWPACSRSAGFGPAAPPCLRYE